MERRLKEESLAKLGRSLLRRVIPPQGETPTPTGISTGKSGLYAHTKNSAMASANKDIDLVLRPSDPSEVDTVVIYIEPPLINLVYRAVEQMGRCEERRGTQEAVKRRGQSPYKMQQCPYTHT